MTTHTKQFTQGFIILWDILYALKDIILASSSPSISQLELWDFQKLLAKSAYHNMGKPVHS